MNATGNVNSGAASSRVILTIWNSSREVRQFHDAFHRAVIRMAFSTHDVVISGGKLDTLLADISAQRLNLLKEHVRAERSRHFLCRKLRIFSSKKWSEPQR